jgi:hypothetical protein
MRKSTHLDDNEEGEVIDSDAREDDCSGVDMGLFCLTVTEGGFHAEAPTILISDY